MDCATQTTHDVQFQGRCHTVYCRHQANPHIVTSSDLQNQMGLFLGADRPDETLKLPARSVRG